VIVLFVDIGGIDDHHCLKFLFIKLLLVQKLLNIPLHSLFQSSLLNLFLIHGLLEILPWVGHIFVNFFYIEWSTVE
jgi:hypothetical protein